MTFDEQLQTMLEDQYKAGDRSDHDKLVVLSGCSAGGKSSLLSEMQARGYYVSPEPGRQIVKEELAIGSDGLPWQNPRRFLDLCLSRAMYFYNSARPNDKPALFDRSIVDTVTGLQRLAETAPPYCRQALASYRYARRVFLAPPWEELFAEDDERKHSFAAAVTEYEALQESYPANGYEIVVIPRLEIGERADFLEEQLRSNK